MPSFGFGFGCGCGSLLFEREREVRGDSFSREVFSFPSHAVFGSVHWKLEAGRYIFAKFHCSLSILHKPNVAPGTVCRMYGHRACHSHMYRPFMKK